LNRKDRAELALSALRDVIPSPQTELEYRDAYQLLVAVMLSAQCTDERVNKVTPAFFEAYPTVSSLAKATPEEIYSFIRSVTYPNSKSKHLVGMGRYIVEDNAGRIPDTPDKLMKIPGVGRKTAQVVAAVAFDVDAFPVDTHVFRVANRIGMTKQADTPLKVEKQLKRLIKQEEWGEAHHLLILFGRYFCTARNPKCDTCSIAVACRYDEQRKKLPDPIRGLDPKKGRYYCRTQRKYFDEPAWKTDRYGTEQMICPHCDSMNVFDAKSGRTMKQVRDFRVNGNVRRKSR